MDFSWLRCRWSDADSGAGAPLYRAPEPPPFHDEAPKDRFCDLVLTGGVTSGVIYPSAVVELARDYRFKNIGGTSAGAMAGALTAAAEYARRCKGSPAGFMALAAVPEELAKDVEVDGKKTTRLLSLFQPTPHTARLFGVFLRLANLGDGSSLRGALVGALVTQYWRSVVLAAAAAATIGLVIRSWEGWVLAAVLAIVFAVVFVWVRVFHDIDKGLVANGYGLCKGSESASEDRPALTDWLHKGIQGIAGLPMDQPLTFAQLWNADAPPDWLKDEVAPWRAINLQMITTNLTHGRPYRLPDDGQTSRLFFAREDLDSYFPREVIDFMWQRAEPYAPRSDEDPVQSPQTGRFRELPVGDLPIVVAARLSLSFPFLFSAVPLWAIDYEPSQREERQLRPCWFSDGGICSNFPIHLFDAFLPRWPTFGINLGRKGPFQKEATWLPTFHNQGRGDVWNRFDDTVQPPPAEARGSLARLTGFVASIVMTAKDWNDKTIMRMPGVRDRVVRVGFEAGEGELNVRLTGDEIRRIARDYGSVAGKKLADKFVGRPLGSASAAWRDHRWVRFNALLASLRERVRAFSRTAELDKHAQPLSQQIANAFVSRPLQGVRPDEAPLNASQSDALDGLLAALKALEGAFDKFDAVQPYRPEPMPNLGNRPPL